MLPSSSTAIETIITGDKRDAAQTGDKTFVNLAFVDFIEKIATVGNQKNLRDEHTCEERTQSKDNERVYCPVSHKN